MYHFDDSADFAFFDAGFDADMDSFAPLTASDLGLQQLGQSFNRATQRVWQCSNCFALNTPASQRFVRSSDDGLKSCVKRADSVSSGFGGASPSSVPSPNASMCCVMHHCACGQSVHGGLGQRVIQRDAASQCDLLTDTGLECFETCGFEQ